MMVKTRNITQEKFRGALVGALVGDCVGSPFEGINNYEITDVTDYLDESEEQNVDLHFTDDTQMTQELADSLIDNKGFNAKDLAQRFVRRYYTEGITASYGANVIEVFRKLQETNFADPLQPAKEQFDGTGSYGNGAAMRVAPVALFCLKNREKLVELAEDQAKITHTHKDAIDGAIFQCLAVQKCILNTVEDVSKFLDEFRTDLIEARVSQKYIDKLNVIALLLQQDKVTNSEVIDQLGNDVAAFRSVPTALFCFLRCLKPILGFERHNHFRRTMEYSISLGGDTDTIASMAGAIAGANFGLEGINIGTWRCCEQADRVLKQADDLFQMNSN